jgi:predicted RNase H-like nuclease
MQVLGIDACRGKWLAIALDENGYLGAGAGADAAALAGRWPDAAAIGIDIPIGLPETPLREADREAREFVGDRRSAVFPTFPAVVLEAPTYEQAKSLAVARAWPMPSLQSYGMRHRISKIGAFAAEDARVFEVHPEVSFPRARWKAALAEANCRWRRRTAEGIGYRSDLAA